MPETTTETTTTETGTGVEATGQFTQDDVDKLVAKARGEEKRKASERYADYDDLKSRAESGKTDVEKLMERLDASDKRAAAAESRALRSDIAAAHGVSAEDRDLYLTGTDEETLTRQAKGLAAKETDRKKNGNVAPKEGGTKTIGGPSKDVREFTNNLFGQTV